MTTFKVETYRPVATSQHLETTPPPRLTLKLQTLRVPTYQTELLPVLSSFFSEDSCGPHAMLKVLQILQHRSDYLGFLQVLEDRIGQSALVYKCFTLWSKVASLGEIFTRASKSQCEQFYALIFGTYFTTHSYDEGSLRSQLASIFKVEYQEKIFSSVKKSYVLRGKELKVAIQKCINVEKITADLEGFIQKYLHYAVESDHQQAAQLIREHGHLGNFLEKNPCFTQINLKCLKNTFSEVNALQQSSNTSILQKEALKEWLNEGNHFWDLLDKYYFNDPHRNTIFNLGKLLSGEGFFSSWLSIKCLYNFFEQRAEPKIEEAILREKQGQAYVDICKGTSHLAVQGKFRIMVINSNFAPTFWRKTNPFKSKLPLPVAVQRLIEEYGKVVGRMQGDFLKENKRMQMAFSTFAVQIHPSEELVILSFDQLLETYQKGPGKDNFRVEYAASAQVSAKPKKDHGIVVEAKVTRLLKRSTKALSPEQISLASGYDLPVVESCLDRLVRKGLAEQAEKKGFIYSP